jgi:tRNA-dihydrouridine synthase A
MVVDQILTHNEDNKRVLHEHLQFRTAEEPVVLQFGGSCPSTLAHATRIAYDYGWKQEFNLNAGCPSCRVAGRGEFGAALMKKPSLIQECLTAMALAAPVSVSLKTRLGVDDFDSFEFFDSLVDSVLATPLPATADFSLVVHARKAWLNGLSPAQNRMIPPLDYDRAFEVCGSKPNLKRWFLNGGINTLDQAQELLARAPSNMEGVMMGRAAMSTPCELAMTDTLLYGESCDPLSAQTRESLLQAYADYLHDTYPNPSAMTVGNVCTALKPTLGVFHGLKGNRQWRVAMDHLARNESLRRELGPAGIIEEAMREIDPEILQIKLTKE